MRLSHKRIFFLILLCMVMVTPVLAGTRYMEGSPELSAYIAGNNELSPGDEIDLNIVIQNSGLNEYKFVQPNIVDWDDLPNTAKSVTVTLQPGTAPLIVKSDPQMIGDLKGANRVNSAFTVKVDSNASAGTYTLPLHLNYSYMYTVDQYGVDTIEYTYKSANITIGMPVTIRSDVSVDVLSATPENLNAGTEGFVVMKIRNTGYENGSKAIVKITQNGNSPIVPVDSSVFVGDFPSGDTVDCRYKVAVSDSAERQIYPVDVAVNYQNTDGDFVTSRSETVGIPVGEKILFEIVSPPAEMHPGSKETISITYKNTGDTEVYSAQARISAVDPFSSNDDIAYLGDIRAGESAVANFVVSVDRSATIKEYGLDSEIRYRDALDNTYISDIMKVPVDVVRPEGIAVILTNPIYLSIVAAVLIGIAYMAYYFRKKNQ